MCISNSWRTWLSWTVSEPRFAYAQESYKQADAQADAGNKAPIEATRSLVEFQTEEQRLRSQLGEVEKRRIQLARLIGLPLGTQIQPQERLDGARDTDPAIAGCCANAPGRSDSI